jgi:mono/diheme cytochrome c family protein
MPELTVAPANVSTASEPAAKVESAPASLSPLLLLRGLALGVGLVGLLLAFQRKSRLAGMVAGLSLIIGIGTFMVGSATPVVEAQSVPVSELSAETSLSQVELGRQLFLAKGCITCHYNSRAASRTDYLTIETGAPDLSNYSSAPEILAIRLKDPAAAKSDTQMPNLELKETEIEALIAFINSK